MIEPARHRHPQGFSTGLSPNFGDSLDQYFVSGSHQVKAAVIIKLPHKISSNIQEWVHEYFDIQLVANIFSTFTAFPKVAEHTRCRNGGDRSAAYFLRFVNSLMSLFGHATVRPKKEGFCGMSSVLFVRAGYTRPFALHRKCVLPKTKASAAVQLRPVRG